MFTIQCLLALAALSVGLTRSWDIAVSTRNQIDFYSNNTKTYSEAAVQFNDLTALAYDAVHNMLLFADKQNDNASIFSYSLLSKKHKALVRRTSYANIHDLAIDPVKGILFWTNTSERSIYWISLSPGSKTDHYGNLLIKMDDEVPKAIAVDSCRGYIYWTNTNIMKPSIERARFDGSERKVIVDSDIYLPVSIAVDQQTQQIYWADDREGIHFTIESADLNGKNRKKLTIGINNQPRALTISKDSIFWVDSDHNTVWELPKNATEVTEPTKYLVFSNEINGIAANYAIEDQIRGQAACEALTNITPKNYASNDTYDIPSDEGLFCVHGIKDGRTSCKCTPGYTGERCDISVCHNYCLQGDCSLTTAGDPQCSCKAGFTGIQCEVNVCRGYCLNNGSCSSNEENMPVCLCSVEYEGSRCETVKTITTTTPANESPATVCNCTKEENKIEMLPCPTPESTSCTGWDTVRDPVILALAVLVGILCLVCVVLITKILQLKKRPRIKKRIIVNKNVTPMTARPDQCEITIENCCNMNICETPCFEPRSTIRPTLLDSKPGKEEKKNLISNMEYPDDPY